jgi:hypothetical protein
MRLPMAWTDADGLAADTSEADGPFGVDVIRTLLEIAEALQRLGVIDGRSGVETREGAAVVEETPLRAGTERPRREGPVDEGMKLTSAQHIGRSQPILRVSPTFFRGA